MKMGKFMKPSGGDEGGRIVKMGKGNFKGGGKGVKKTQFQKPKIVYVQVPVQTYTKPQWNQGGGKSSKKFKGSGKGGQAGKSDKGKGGGQWKLVPKGKKKKEVFW